MIGAPPHTDWLAPALSLDKDGFVLTARDIPGTNWALEREPYPFEKSRLACSPPATFATARPKELPVRSAKDPSQWDPSTATSPRPAHSKDSPRRDGLDRHKLGRPRDGGATLCGMSRHRAPGDISRDDGPDVSLIGAGRSSLAAGIWKSN